MKDYRIAQDKRPWALTAQAPKLRVGSCMEKVLKWFNYSRAKAHPGCEVSCQGVLNQLVASSVLCRGQPDWRKLYRATNWTDS